MYFFEHRICPRETEALHLIDLTFNTRVLVTAAVSYFSFFLKGIKAAKPVGGLTFSSTDLHRSD